MNTFASRFALLALALSAVSLAPVTFAQDNSSSAGSSSSSPSSQPMHQAPDPQKQTARLTKRLALSLKIESPSINVMAVTAAVIEKSCILH